MIIDIRVSILSAEEAASMESHISMEEIEMAVWSCEGSKPGPDGLNFNFIKKFWPVLKDAFFKAVARLESTGRLSMGCNASFLALIPKKRDPLLIDDFRPISLLDCFYKIIGKILAARLAKVLDKVISPNQSAFIQRRQILDGNLIANEIVNFASKKGMELMLFKADFAKAFDSVN